MQKLKIVLTDCDTLNKNDLDLSLLEQFGEVTYYGSTPANLTAERIADADIIIINKTIIGAAELDAAKHLRLVCLFATGYNNVDVVYARQRGISVANAGSYSTSAVAQQVFAYILSHACAIRDYDSGVKNGEWIRSKLFCFFSRPTVEVAGKVLGIFGYGAIGKQVARIAHALDMRVLVCTRTPQLDNSVEFVDFDTLLAQSDFLTAHCPLTDATKQIFDEAAFSKCKKGMYFINTARGGVISEQALFNALESGQLSGAAIDVLSQEPMRADCVLRNAKNITITPHVAWAPYETRTRLLNIVISNIQCFLDGNPKNIVN